MVEKRRAIVENRRPLSRAALPRNSYRRQQHHLLLPCRNCPWKPLLLSRFRKVASALNSDCRRFLTKYKIILWLVLWWKPIHIIVVLSKMFFAGVSLIAALGFVLYGGRLFLMLQRFPVESKGRRKKLQEGGYVTNICFLCFIVRCNMVGRNDYYMTLITNGEWRVSGTKWTYERKRLAKGVDGDNIKCETIKENIAEKISFDPDRYEIELKYASSMRENFPSFEINDEDDWEAYKFLNMKSKEP